MKKVLAFIAMALISTIAMAKPTVLWSPIDYHIYGISHNGKWATGVYSDYSYTTHGFLWDLENDEITMLGNPYDKSEGWSVSDEGIVAGRFTSHDVLENGVGAVVPGIYRNGQWEMLELPNGCNIDDSGGEFFFGTALAISDDGRYVSGSTVRDFDYFPCVWLDGKLLRQLDIYNPQGGMIGGMPYCISYDGMKVGGWSLGYDSRHASIWNTADGSRKLLTDHEWIYDEVTRFSPDGKKLLVTADRNYLYDVETDKLQPVNGMGYMNSMSGNYTIVGTGTAGASMLRYGASTPVSVTSYLRGLGADFSEQHVASFTECRDISADESVFALSTATFDGSGEYQDVRSCIVIVNKDNDHSAPLSVQTRQLEAQQTVEVAWRTPKTAPENITKFNIYANDKLVGSTDGKTTVFYHKNLTDGNYTYHVVAVYGDAVETKSQLSAVTVKTKPVAQPENIFVRQKGANSILAQWDAPHSNLVDLKWYNPADADLRGFGILRDQSDIEVGIGFKASELSNYTNCKLTDVEFYPMSEQPEWFVRVYEYKDNAVVPTLVYEQKITQGLNYKQRNSVKLDTPVAIDGSSDMIVAIGVTVEYGNPDIVGIDFSHCRAGYSDLMRLKEEPDFYSYYDFSSQYGSAQYNTFMIDAILTPEGTAAGADEVTSYSVTLDGKEVEQVTPGYKNEGQQICIKEVADGNHTFAVKAIYGNGVKSNAATAGVATKLTRKIAENFEIKQNIDDITVSWTTPLDDDATDLCYCSDTPATTAEYGAMGTEENNYGIAASVVYEPSKLRGFGGYKIKALKFYPTADAIFTLQVFENSKQIYEEELDEFNLNQWNSYDLPANIIINESSTYRFAVDCYDVEPYKAPIAMDARLPLSEISDAVSVDNGASWVGVGEESALYGNWLMKMELIAPDTAPMPVEGYDVMIDSKAVNTELILPNADYTKPHSFEVKDLSIKRHSVRVGTHYKGLTSALMTALKYVYVTEADGIENVTVNNSNNAKTYDLQGRNYISNVNRPRIAIIGKKKVVK